MCQKIGIDRPDAIEVLYHNPPDGQLAQGHMWHTNRPLPSKPPFTHSINLLCKTDWNPLLLPYVD